MATHAAEVTSIPVDIRVTEGDFTLLSSVTLETNSVINSVSNLLVTVVTIWFVSLRVNGCPIGFKCQGGSFDNQFG